METRKLQKRSAAKDVQDGSVASPQCPLPSPSPAEQQRSTAIAESPLLQELLPPPVAAAALDAPPPPPWPPPSGAETHRSQPQLSTQADAAGHQGGERFRARPPPPSASPAALALAIPPAVLHKLPSTAAAAAPSPATPSPAAMPRLESAGSDSERQDTVSRTLGGGGGCEGGGGAESKGESLRARSQLYARLPAVLRTRSGGPLEVPCTPARTAPLLWRAERCMAAACQSE